MIIPETVFCEFFVMYFDIFWDARDFSEVAEINS